MANLLNERLNEDEIDKQQAKEQAKILKEEKKKQEKAKKKEKTYTQTIESKKAEEVAKEEPTEEFEAKIEALTGEDFVKEQKAIKKRKRNFYAVKILLCLLCANFLFLIYGVVVTEYDYDDNGRVVPQIMTSEEIAQKKEFEVLLGYYYDARSLYEKILSLNYRLEKGIEQPLTLVPEYESLLDISNRVLIDLKAYKPMKAFQQAYNMLGTWVNADLSSYIQEISMGISQNSQEHLTNAYADKERCYNNCKQLTANMISLGETVKGVNVSILKEWSPTKYIEEEMGGI